MSVRAAVAGLDPTRHTVIYVANPAFGTRGLYVTIVRALGAEPRFHKAEVMAGRQPAGWRGGRASPPGADRGRRGASAIARPARGAPFVVEPGLHLT
ncbi:MAG: hypothetical protein DLM54_04050 [Acidimicrobiales bacterium]|nr:MAG: hypothetical protein DLM54_04050 [Acidimicrobiales bacterium]